MKISINWLKEHLPFTQSLEEIVDALITEDQASRLAAEETDAS